MTMIDAQKVRTYHQTVAEIRRLSGAGFDRDRHHEVQRAMLLARERQRLQKHRSLTMPGTSKRIIALTAKAAGVDLGDLMSDRRTREVYITRQAAAWLLKKHTRHSATEIGRRLGGKDHSTIFHSYRRVKEDLDSGGDRYGALIAVVERELGVA